jgi:hypothetical protein
MIFTGTPVSRSNGNKIQGGWRSLEFTHGLPTGDEFMWMPAPAALETGYVQGCSTNMPKCGPPMPFKPVWMESTLERSPKQSAVQP